MPSYFFHTDGLSRLTDKEGVQMQESELAIEALEFLAESLRGRSREFWRSPAYRVVVTNEDGLILYVLDLSGSEAPGVKSRREEWEQATPAPDGKPEPKVG